MIHLPPLSGFILLLAVSVGASASAEPVVSSRAFRATCSKFLERGSVFSAAVVKIRADGTKIYELRFPEGQTYYFKEAPRRADLRFEIFDDPKMAVLATHIAENFQLEKFIAPSSYFDAGIEIPLGETFLITHPGILQRGKTGLISPLDEFARLHPGKTPSAIELGKILNSGDWPRLYADWKIFWRIFQQTDLNIANLSRDADTLYMFDLGDLLNQPATRARMGIWRDAHNMHFNMPDKPWDRIEHRADLRQADPEFKKLVRDVAALSEDALAAKLGKNLNESLGKTRGSVSKLVHAMKYEANWLLYRLDRGPFDY